MSVRPAGAVPRSSVPPELIASLTALLDQEDWRVRRMAVAALAPDGAALVDALVATLGAGHDNINVLSALLDLIAEADIDVGEPLLRLLDAEAADLRLQAVLLLGLRRERRAVPGLLARLDDPDVNVRFQAIEALGDLRAYEAVDALVAIAERRDFFLAFPAIQALGRIGTLSVVPRLLPLLDDDGLRVPVVEALGALGDEDVVPPLVRLLNEGAVPAETAADALAGVHARAEARYGAGGQIADRVRRAISAEGTLAVLETVERVSADRLRGVATLLGWLEGDAVRRALTRLLGREGIRASVVEALVRYGAGAVDVLVRELTAEDLETRQAAAVALGRIGDSRAVPALVAVLDDRELAVAAAGALARIGDGSAFDALMRRLGHPDGTIRRSIVGALNSIGHADMPCRIAALFDADDPALRESAVEIAGYFGYPDCLDRLLARCRDEVERVRRAAVAGLPCFDDPRVFGALAEALERDTPRVRAAAAAAIVQTDHPARTPALIRAAADADAWVRYAALRSLGALRDPTALPAVLAALVQDAAPVVRLAAIDAAGRLGPPEALDLLDPLAWGADRDVARAAIGALAHLADPGAVAALERALRAPEAWRRLAAVEALGRRPDAHAPVLLAAAAAVEHDPEVAHAAIHAIEGIASGPGAASGGAARALIELAGAGVERDSVVAALARLPARRLPEVASALAHADAGVRTAAVEALARMRRADASMVLDRPLDETAAAVRLTALVELKRLGARTPNRKLIALARTDPDEAVRRAAVVAMAHAGAAPVPGRAV